MHSSMPDADWLAAQCSELALARARRPGPRNTRIGHLACKASGNVPRTLLLTTDYQHSPDILLGSAITRRPPAPLSNCLSFLGVLSREQLPGGSLVPWSDRRLRSLSPLPSHLNPNGSDCGHSPLPLRVLATTCCLLLMPHP